MYSSLIMMVCSFSLIVCSIYSLPVIQFMGSAGSKLAQKGTQSLKSMHFQEIRYNLDLKKAVDNLPTDGITQEELDRVLSQESFRPKTDMLLKQARGSYYFVYVNCRENERKYGRRWIIERSNDKLCPYTLFHLDLLCRTER